MTWFGQGHSKWVNLSLKHITVTRHSDIPRGPGGGEIKRESKIQWERDVEGENYKKERGQREKPKGHFIHHAYDSLMFPFITTGSLWGEGETGHVRCKKKRKAKNARKRTI